MAIQMQSLVLRAAAIAGARATVGSKRLQLAVDGNPARVLSLPRHPLPGPYPTQTGTEPGADHRTPSMDPLARRAGRSASVVGVPGRSSFARFASGSILSGWPGSKSGTVVCSPLGCAGGPLARG